MYYAPHKLEKWVETIVRDPHGRLKPAEAEEGRWEYVCSCRAEIDTTRTLTSPDRQTIDHQISVTADLHPLKGGERVRVVRADGSVIGEGQVKSIRTAEYLQYMSFFI